MPNSIDSVRIEGFRSLADVEIKDLPAATVPIGANGSGKPGFIHFFEMLSWMLKFRRSNEFIQLRAASPPATTGTAFAVT